MMDSKDNKCKYADHDREEEAKEFMAPKKQRTNDNDNGDGDSSSSNGFSSEPGEEVSSEEEEEINLPADSDEKLLI
jgi:hypothetical protein